MYGVFFKKITQSYNIHYLSSEMVKWDMGVIGRVVKSKCLLKMVGLKRRA
jgi:hypothetical protein